MIYTYLLSFVETAEEFQQLSTLRAVIQQVMDILRREWPDLDPWPVFPVFQID